MLCLALLQFGLVVLQEPPGLRESPFVFIPSLPDASQGVLPIGDLSCKLLQFRELILRILDRSDALFAHRDGLPVVLREVAPGYVQRLCPPLYLLQRVLRSAELLVRPLERIAGGITHCRLTFLWNSRIIYNYTVWLLVRKTCLIFARQKDGLECTLEIMNHYRSDRPFEEFHGEESRKNLDVLAYLQGLR